MSFPFEVPFTEVEAKLDVFVDEVFGSLIRVPQSSERRWFR